MKREAEKLERKNTGGSRKQGGRRGTERGDTKEMIDNETVSRETGISFGGAKPVFTSNKPKTHAPLD